MKIGIDASRAFLQKRTGIEQYSYQIIKNLRNHLDKYEVILYVRKWKSENIDFDLPKNWSIREIPYVYGWTQVGLALEMLLRPIDVYFSPAHTTAIIHPQKTVVTIHGLEYEHCPEGYSQYARWFHRFFIKKSCRWATRIIAVSQNTKKDLVNLYEIKKEKIKVVYNGFCSSNTRQISKQKRKKSYIFYIGRIEQRKNIKRIIKAFEIIKRRKSFDGELLLAGGPGHGYDQIKELIDKSAYKKDIHELGFVDENEKWSLLRGAEIFLFPSLCEGFGIPILEAQSVGVPVITSKLGPLDEVAGNEEILIDPRSTEAIAKKIEFLLSNVHVKERVVEKGYENLNRFSWNKSAKETTSVLKEVIRQISQD